MLERGDPILMIAPFCQGFARFAVRETDARIARLSTAVGQ
jgi:hypothetical protein